MPYSNKKRLNPPSTPQTPYQPLIIPCPNFEPIYHVIPSKKKDPKKKKQGLKSKRGETLYEELHVTKKG
jgi:hypothetical protein